MALVEHADASSQALLNTSKPKLSTSSWWSRGNAQWVVQQMRVGWRAGFQRLKTGTFGYGSKPQQKIIGAPKLTGVGREANNLTP
jgi:hypothetical protein